MILTDKARKDFETWLDSDDDNLCGLDLFQLNNTCIYALIIEWFDSVGIYITLDICRLNGANYGFTSTIWSKGFRKFDDIENFNSRPEATEQAIIKANEIYNNLNK